MAKISGTTNYPAIVRTALAAALLIAVAACGSVGPDYHRPPQAIAERPAAAGALLGASEAPFQTSALPPHWWRLYRDETLDRLIEKALVANADLRIASANLARARAVLDEVAVLEKPSLAVNAAPAYGRPAAAELLRSTPLPDSGLYDTGGKVSYQVDLFGKIARAIEASTADTQAAQAGYDLARITVAADTARAYAEACSANQQTRVARHSIELQQQFVELTEKRVQAGRATPLDTSRARSLLEQLHAALPPLLAQHRIAQYRLAVLIGDLPGTLPPDVEQCRAAPRLTAPIPVGDGQALLRRRPDIRQAERRLAAASARIGVATADLYPSISLGLSAGSSGELAQFGAANTLRWSLGPLISWTLPVTSSARSRIAQAESDSDAALAHFDATVLNALRETESALTTYARELDRNAALQAARDQSALAAQQTHALYRYGRSDFLTTLDTDRTLAAAESVLAASDAQLAAQQVSLLLALGGGWEQATATRPN